jgi:hypothetical protein
MSYKQRKRKTLIKAYQEAGYEFGKFIARQTNKVSKGIHNIFTPDKRKIKASKIFVPDKKRIG